MLTDIDAPDSFGNEIAKRDRPAEITKESDTENNHIITVNWLAKRQNTS